MVVIIFLFNSFHYSFTKPKRERVRAEQTASEDCLKKGRSLTDIRSDRSHEKKEKNEIDEKKEMNEK
jgi:hypothetical protein